MNNPQTRRMIGFVAFSFFGFFFAANLSAQEPASQLREFRGRTMGTTYMVKVSGADQIDDDTIRFSVDAELRRVNDQMSTYLESSEITAFNRSQSTDWFDVSSEFAQVVDAALRIAKLSDGALDITVAPLVNAWSFGPGERSRKIPNDDQIKELLQSTGYQELSVRLDPPALRKAIPELQIDLSSIAKGHGVDRVVNELASLGAENVFVEIGGEVRTSGAKPSGPWRVGIQMPDAASDTVMVAHSMQPEESAGNSMATSGDYRNVYEVDGKRYSHTIDPRTGSPVEHQLASVTVIAKTCMEADAWATALNVLGGDLGQKVAQQNDVHALLISRKSEQGFQRYGTGVLQQYAVAQSPDSEVTKSESWISSLVPIAILTFLGFSILLFAMAIGVVFGRKSISGSCGGVASKTNEDGSTSCSLCSNPSDACKELREKMATSKQESSAEQ